MIIDAVAAYLSSHSLGTLGTDLFIGELPYDVSDCISLMLVPSPAPSASIAYYTQVIDVWGRFVSFETGLLKLSAIYDFLHRKEHYEISGFHIYLSSAMELVDDMDRDLERRHLLKVSFSFLYRKSELLS